MKLINYLLSDRSNRLLILIIVLLVNLLSLGWYARIDLTEGDTYSLSAVSRRTIASLEEPLTVSVFFSPDLPAPYNGVARYLRDLLAEYGGVGNPNFSYRFVDMESDEGRETAESYGIYSLQVQEVRSDEFQSRNVYMGIALSYGSNVEQLGEITGTDGLEYRLTTTISRMVGTVEAAASLNRSIETVLYYSPALAEFNIAGFDQLTDIVSESVAAVNRANNDLLELEVRTVDASDEAEALSREYGFQRIGYSSREDAAEEQVATLGILMQLDDRFQVLPIDLSREIFGGYALAGLNNLEERIGEGLEALLNTTPPVGYVVGHGERGLNDTQTGAALFQSLAQDLYQFRELNLAEDEIPINVSTLIVNGPKSPLSEAELYALDQFLMRGGSLLLFLDPFQVIQPQVQGMPPGSPPVYLPVSSGIEALLPDYGIDLGENYVLDQRSYQAQQQFGPLNLYHIPILEKESLDQSHPVSTNLGQVVMLASSSVEPAGRAPEGVAFTQLATSSPESWLMEGQIDLSPMSISPPPEEEQSRRGLVLLAEGEFSSHFDGEPQQSAGADGDLSGSRFLEKSLRPGRIIVAGSSELTGPQLLDPEGRSPNAIFVRNMLDYLNGNEELPLMRSKGLNLNPLGETTPEYRSFVKGFAMGGMPILVILAGLIVWRRREARREAIRRRFSAAGGKA